MKIFSQRGIPFDCLEKCNCVAGRVSAAARAGMQPRTAAPTGTERGPAAQADAGCRLGARSARFAEVGAEVREDAVLQPRGHLRVGHHVRQPRERQKLVRASGAEKRVA